MHRMHTHTRRSVTSTALVAATTGLFAIAAPVASAATSTTSSAFALAVVDTTAPVLTTVTPHPGSLQVAWTAPTTGAPVRGYVVLATSGTTVKSSAVVLGDTLEASVAGLTNGNTYHISVVPFRDSGVGTSSNVIDGTPLAASPVTAISEAAQSVSASKGLGFATVAWAAPVSDGGSTIVAYSVVAVDRAGGALAGWRNVRPDVRSASLTGLTGGHTYDLYVLPVNSLGFGKVAPAVAVTLSSTSVVAPKPPTAPAWATAVPTGDTAVVSWGAAFEQGEAVTKYNVIVIQNEAMTAWSVVGADSRTVTVPLAENGEALVYVIAQSATGYGSLPIPVPVNHAAV
jgi:hypothetical protein